MQPKSSSGPATAEPSEPSEPSENATWVGEKRDLTAESEEDERETARTSGEAVHLPDGGESEDAFEEEARLSIAGAYEIDVGRIIDGRYRVEALLGEGAVGLVYRCRHLVLGRDVAIKVLRPDFARHPEVSERLVLEAKTASSIGNPHIIETVDFGRLLDGTAFFVMEYLDGAPLTDVATKDPPLSADDVLHLAIQIAEGLEAAHAAGIVHRDLKPDNVFVVSRKDNPLFVKILDFGIAKVARAESKLTRAGQIYGTPHYMSPEQASGRVTDARTDIYALGVILYELSTGRVPFDAEEPMGILSQHMHDEPPELTTVVGQGGPVAKGLSAIVRKCLAKDPAERYQDMVELRSDLTRLRGGSAPHAVATAPPRGRASGEAVAAQKPSTGTRRAYVVAAAALVMSVALGYALSVKKETVVFVETQAPAPPVQPTPKLIVPPAEPARARAEEQAKKSVVVVVIPHDAIIDRDGEDLGEMPVIVDVPDGETVHLGIRKPGYVSRRLALDGSKNRVIVGLVPERTARGSKVRPSAVAEAQADKAAEQRVAVDDVGFTTEERSTEPEKASPPREPAEPKEATPKAELRDGVKAGEEASPPATSEAAEESPPASH